MGQEALPLGLAGLILGRDVWLSGMALYYRWISLPQPRTVKRFWDFSLPSAEVKPTDISKLNTMLQLLLVGATMGGLAWGDLDAKNEEKKKEEGQSKEGRIVMDKLDGGGETARQRLRRGLGETGMMALEASWWVVGFTTVVSGLGYIRGRRGLKILGQSKNGNGKKS